MEEKHGSHSPSVRGIMASDTSGERFGPEPTPLRRLLFYWMIVSAFFITIPISLLQIAGHQLWPTAGHFKFWARLWGQGILRSVGITAQVTDHAGLPPDGPCVFIVNHQSLIDILALAGWLPYPFGFVAKVELSRVPFLGLAMRNSACVFIDRGDPRASLESLKKAGERIRSGNSVLVFVEGSRSYAPHLLPFKKGAFLLALEAGVPLVPVTVVDAYRVMDERDHLVQPGRIHIVIGEPLEIGRYRRRDLPDVMAVAEARIAGPLSERASN